MRVNKTHLFQAFAWNFFKNIVGGVGCNGK